MKLIKEQEQTVVKLDFDMTEDEVKKLEDYADANMPCETLAELKIEWAVNDMFKKEIEKMELLENKNKG